MLRTWRWLIKNSMLGLALALAAPALAQAPAREASFSGPLAVGEAGQFITAAIGYTHDYDPGRVVIEFIPVFERAFITSALFSPARGHQVILSKGENEVQHGDACAGFRITVEIFTRESLRHLEGHPDNGGLRVERSDTVRGRVCINALRIRVQLEDVALARLEDGRPSFASPYAANVGGGF